MFIYMSGCMCMRKALFAKPPAKPPARPSARSSSPKEVRSARVLGGEGLSGRTP